MIKRFYIILTLIILTGIYTKFLIYEEVITDQKPLKEFPQKIGQWKYLNDYKFKDEIIQILKVDDYLQRDFINNGKIVSLYIGYYKTHRKFAEIHTPENCQAGGGWVILNEKKRQLNINGEKIYLIEALYEKDQRKEIFYYWYKVGNNYITNFFKYKIFIIKNSLLNHKSNAAFFRISVHVSNNNLKEARETGESFLKEIIPILNNFIKS